MRRFFRKLRARFRRRRQGPEPRVRSFHPPTLYRLRQEGAVRDLSEEDLRRRPRRPRQRFLDRNRRPRGYYGTDGR